MINFKKRKTVLNLGFCLILAGTALMMIGAFTGIDDKHVNPLCAIPSLILLISGIVVGARGKSIEE